MDYELQRYHATHYKTKCQNHKMEKAYFHQSTSNMTVADLTTLPFFPGVSKFFNKSPGLPVRPPNLLGNTYCGLIFMNVVIFKMSKRKIKKEVDLVFLCELFSIRKCKESNQIDLFNKYSIVIINNYCS